MGYRRKLKELIVQVLRPAGRPKLADLIEHVKGTVNSRVPDLASNPKHLEGFGRDHQG